MKKTISIMLTLVILFTGVTVFAVPSSWAVDEVNKARSANLIPNGFSSDYTGNISREEFCELVVLFYDKLKADTNTEYTMPFTDTVSKSVAKAYSLGIVKGTSETTFSPTAPITRQEICVMITRALKAGLPSRYIADSYPNVFPDIAQIADWAKISVQYMNMNYIMLGDENGNINPLGNTTREQAIALVYRLFTNLTDEAMKIIQGQFLTTSGQTHNNMINGAFAITLANGETYISDKTGVSLLSSSSKVSLVSGEVSSLLVLSDNLFYNKNASLYSFDLILKTETKISDDNAKNIIIANDKLYFVNQSDDNKIYSINKDGSEKAVFVEEPSETIISHGTQFFYSTNRAIYKIDTNKNKTMIYEGLNTKTSIYNGSFYFLNELGNLCTVSQDGQGFKVLSNTSIKAFCTTRNFIIALGNDNNVYKTDYALKSFVKIDIGTYEAINTYDNYVYAKTADGEIYKFNNDSTEKVKLN